MRGLRPGLCPAASTLVSAQASRGEYPRCPQTTSSLSQASCCTPHRALLCSSRAHPLSLCTSKLHRGLGSLQYCVGVFFFFKKKNTRIVLQSSLFSAILVRTALPPCSSPKFSRIFNFTSKGAKETHDKAKAYEWRAGSTDLSLTPTALLSGNTISLLHKDLALSGKLGSLHFSKCGKMLGGPQQESIREVPAHIIIREGCSARGSARPGAEPKFSC